MEGFIQYLRKNGELGSLYPLATGGTTIGASLVAADVRLKINHPHLEDIHCVIEVNDEGVATLINKSKAAPVLVNNVPVKNTRVLRHEDRFDVVGKVFQYVNQYLNEEEIVKVEKKLQMVSLTPSKSERRSVMPLLKTKGSPPKTPRKSTVVSSKVPGKITPLVRSLSLSSRSTPRAMGISLRKSVSGPLTPKANLLTKKVLKTPHTDTKIAFNKKIEALKESEVSTPRKLVLNPGTTGSNKLVRTPSKTFKSEMSPDPWNVVPATDSDIKVSLSSCQTYTASPKVATPNRSLRKNSQTPGIATPLAMDSIVEESDTETIHVTSDPHISLSNNLTENDSVKESKSESLNSFQRQSSILKTSPDKQLPKKSLTSNNDKCEKSQTAVPFRISSRRPIHARVKSPDSTTGDFDVSPSSQKNKKTLDIPAPGSARKSLRLQKSDSSNSSDVFSELLISDSERESSVHLLVETQTTQSVVKRSLRKSAPPYSPETLTSQIYSSKSFSSYSTSPMSDGQINKFDNLDKYYNEVFSISTNECEEQDAKRISFALKQSILADEGEATIVSSHSISSEKSFDFDLPEDDSEDFEKKSSLNKRQSAQDNTSVTSPAAKSKNEALKSNKSFDLLNKAQNSPGSIRKSSPAVPRHSPRKSSLESRMSRSMPTVSLSQLDKSSGDIKKQNSAKCTSKRNSKSRVSVHNPALSVDWDQAENDSEAQKLSDRVIKNGLQSTPSSLRKSHRSMSLPIQNTSPRLEENETKDREVFDNSDDEQQKSRRTSKRTSAMTRQRSTPDSQNKHSASKLSIHSYDLDGLDDNNVSSFFAGDIVSNENQNESTRINKRFSEVVRQSLKNIRPSKSNVSKSTCNNSLSDNLNKRSCHEDFNQSSDEVICDKNSFRKSSLSGQQSAASKSTWDDSLHANEELDRSNDMVVTRRSSRQLLRMSSSETYDEQPVDVKIQNSINPSAVDASEESNRCSSGQVATPGSSTSTMAKLPYNVFVVNMERNSSDVQLVSNLDDSLKVNNSNNIQMLDEDNGEVEYITPRQSSTKSRSSRHSSAISKSAEKERKSALSRDIKRSSSISKSLVGTPEKSGIPELRCSTVKRDDILVDNVFTPPDNPKPSPVLRKSARKIVINPRFEEEARATPGLRSLIRRSSTAAEVVDSTTPDQSIDDLNVETETPKSALKPRRSKSLYNPPTEDITPVSPIRTEENSEFKTPINTPGLFETLKKSVMRSRKRRRETSNSVVKSSKKMKLSDDDSLNGDDDLEINVSSSSSTSGILNSKNIRKILEKKGRSPKNDLTDVRGVKRLMATPREIKSPKNNLTNIGGVKQLFRTPKIQGSPKNDLTNVRNLRAMMSPKARRSPKNDLTNVPNLRNVIYPREQKSPENDLTDVPNLRNVVYPREQNSPENDLTNVPNLRNVVYPREQKSPENDLTNIPNLRNIVYPREQKSPENDLTNIPNLRRVMSSRNENSPKNDLTSPKGVKKLMATPRLQKEPTNDLSDMEGVEEIFNVSGVDMLHQGSDIENCEDLFDKLMGRPHFRTYRPKSLTPSKNLPQPSARRRTTGDALEMSPRVEKWVEEQSKLLEKAENQVVIEENEMAGKQTKRKIEEVLPDSPLKDISSKHKKVLEEVEDLEPPGTKRTTRGRKAKQPPRVTRKTNRQEPKLTENDDIEDIVLTDSEYQEMKPKSERQTKRTVDTGEKQHIEHIESDEKVKPRRRRGKKVTEIPDKEEPNFSEKGETQVEEHIEELKPKRGRAKTTTKAKAIGTPVEENIQIVKNEQLQTDHVEPVMEVKPKRGRGKKAAKSQIEDNIDIIEIKKDTEEQFEYVEEIKVRTRGKTKKAAKIVKDETEVVEKMEQGEAVEKQSEVAKPTRARAKKSAKEPIPVPLKDEEEMPEDIVEVKPKRGRMKRTAKEQDITQSVPEEKSTESVEAVKQTRGRPRRAAKAPVVKIENITIIDEIPEDEDSKPTRGRGKRAVEKVELETNAKSVRGRKAKAPASIEESLKDVAVEEPKMTRGRNAKKMQSDDVLSSPIRLLNDEETSTTQGRRRRARKEDLFLPIIDDVKVVETKTRKGALKQPEVPEEGSPSSSKTTNKSKHVTFKQPVDNNPIPTEGTRKSKRTRK